MIHISDACFGCMLCAEVCPEKCITVERGKAYYSGESCIGCLHCAAVCPVGAITQDGIVACLDVPTKPLPETLHDDLKLLVMQRRSCRRFTEQPVPEDLLTNALRTADWAPSAYNEHPVHWVIVRSKEIKNRIMQSVIDYCETNKIHPEITAIYAAGSDMLIGQNATLLLAYCRHNTKNPVMDTTVALETVELLLQAQGIGTCWGGYLALLTNEIPDLRHLFEIPAGCSVYGAMMLGWPAEEHYKKIPNRRVKQAEIVFLDRAD